MTRILDFDWFLDGCDERVKFFFSVEIGSRYKNDYLMEEMRNDRKFKSIAFNPFQLLKNDTAMVS